MSLTLENIGAAGKLAERFRKIADADPTVTIPGHQVPLMVTWENIIRDDNRRGVLAGTDKDGGYMIAVTYRPVQDKGKHINIRAKSAARLRLGQSPSRMRGLIFAGFGPQAAGLNNNLTSAEYRRLTGPPLAPRGQFSRVITNLLTDHARLGLNRWTAFGYWDQVVDKKGRPFLHYHFEGSGRLPQRDLRGVRPEGIEKARAAAVAWMRDMVRTYGG